MNLYSIYMEACFNLWKEPGKAIAVQTQFYTDTFKLWHNSTLDLYTNEKSDPIIKPDNADRRFRNPEWDSNLFFRHIKQSYLLASRCMMETAEAVNDLDEKSRKRLQFFTRQIIDSLSPTNFVYTNPTVMRETIDTHGNNLIKGMQNYLRDLQQGNGELKINMTDKKAFKPGKNIATTSGKVIYQNDLHQLIQYSATTTKVYKRPLLIIPPWINKYYILDLQPNNSMIKWLVDQGHTVFVISWINPNKDLADKNFEHYMSEGLLDALDQIENVCNINEVNALGYCLGGTLLAAGLAYMAVKQDKRIKAATFLTTLIDFSEPGDLGVFIDEQQVSKLEEQMEKEGFLDGKSMSSAFNMLRSNDLIWSFYINNYLMGKDPMAFDLLYWNSDNTRLPAAMQSFYLRNMYVANKLKDPGGIKLHDVAIDIRNINTPSYFISTSDDHITPWKSTYDGAKLLSGPVKFVLGGSGHIAGIVNPPVDNKHGYRTNKTLSKRKKLPANPQTWLEGTEQYGGSWWLNWQDWINDSDNRKVNARKPGKRLYEELQDAPGCYVFM